jgi:hypothetical protein
MNNLFNIDDYISEKKVTVKRRYTEKYPARKMSTAARVRSAIFTAMGEGVLTEEELKSALASVKAHKRWLSRNVSLFNISEDESGIKSYSLSVFGNRVKLKTIKLNEAETLNEAEVTPEMLLQVQQALPDLEKLIQKHSGVKAKLMAEMNRENLHIYSDNLIGQISPLGRTVFKEINISFWGGSYIEKTNQIWFNPKTDYEHPSGGSNGADFIWQSLWFKLDKNAWVEGRRLGR